MDVPQSYIVTFYSHFGAIRFKKECDKAGIAARTMPVPRDLSSSCGTCVRCGRLPGLATAAGETHLAALSVVTDEVEQVAAVLEAGYSILYKAQDS